MRFFIVCFALLLFACRPNNNTGTSDPITDTTQGTAALQKCFPNQQGATAKFSISPDGQYLLEFAISEYSDNGKYRRGGVVFPGRKVFLLRKIVKNNLSASIIHTFEVSSEKQSPGYAWAQNNHIYFRPLQYGTPLIEYIPDISKSSKVTSEQDEVRLLFEKQSTISQPIFNQFYIAIKMQGTMSTLRYNKYGEAIFLFKFNNNHYVEMYLLNSHMGNSPITIIPTDQALLKKEMEKYSNTPILSFSINKQTLTQLSADSFQYYKVDTPNQNNKVHYFYFILAEDGKYTTLFRYDDTAGGGVTSKIFAFGGANIAKVSTNRDGSKLYWAYSDSASPQYHFFSKDAEKLFSLISPEHSHRTDIISIDNNERIAIIKHQSDANLVQYFLVDTQKLTSKLLSSCQNTPISP